MDEEEHKNLENESTLHMLHQKADVFMSELGENPSPDVFLKKVQDMIVDHAHSLPEDKRKSPNSLLESRFTPVGEQFKAGMLSCGAMTNIATEMARHVGYDVKLVHGKNNNSIHHAWMMILQGDTWEQFDITKNDLKANDGHEIKAVCNEWKEIQDQLVEDHNKWLEKSEKS